MLCVWRLVITNLKLENEMRLFKHWFIVKRPYMTVLKKAEDFIKQYPPDNGLNNERSLQMRRVGYQDGYVACLEDLGIKQTIENVENRKSYEKGRK